MKLPYGISNFSSLRKEGFVYLDRSQAIPAIESAGKQLLFLRPRRFGKSLLTSTLHSYYDVKQADQFAALFGELAIGQNPTSEHNKYLVLQWDFSIVSAQGSIEQIRDSLFRHLNENIKAFAHKYADCLPTDITIYAQDGIASFEALVNVVGESGYQLYLLIDEYDNFANEVLMHNQGDKPRYRALLEGEGVLKTLFKVIKAGASQGAIARVFITGVSPVAISDISTNISLDPRFYALCGILPHELKQLATDVLANFNHEAELENVLSTMQQFYNGYRFSYDMDAPRVYNPILCLHFLRHYQLERTAPRNMMDSNLAMDAGRIRYIANLAQGQAVIDSILDEENPATLSQLASDFGIENLERVEQDTDYMLSLLYYFGVLTLGGVDNYGSLILKIPNLVVHALYLEELKRQTLPYIRNEKTAQQFFRDADLQPW